jgi:hypothetical protein
MKDSFILGAVVPGEASETMVKLFLWLSIVLLRKLAILGLYLDHSTYDTVYFYVLGLQKREKVKPFIVP